MKSFKKILSDYSLVFMIAVMLLIVVGIVIANIFWQTPEDWRSLAFDLMSDLISAICVGLVVATFTKIISNHIFKVTKNDRKLKSFGIDAIGEELMKLTAQSITLGLVHRVKLTERCKSLVGNGFYMNLTHIDFLLLGK